MKKKVLAMFMAVFVTAGTVLAPAETGIVYAAQAAEEQTEEITPETETELQTEVPGEETGEAATEQTVEESEDTENESQTEQKADVTAQSETAETEAEVSVTEETEVPETQTIQETEETEAETAWETEEIEETEKTETRSAALAEMPAGLMQFEAVGEITVDTPASEEVEDVLKSSAYYNNTWEKYGSYYFYNQLSKNEKAYWDALNKVCLKYMTTQANATKYAYNGTTYYHVDGVFSSDLSLTQMEEVYQIFRYSNPQYYFLKSAYFRMVNNINGAYGIAACVYPAFATGSSRASETKKVQSQVSSWQSKINACSTDAQKVKLIHDLIIDKVEYNQTLYDNDFKDEDTQYSQSAYSVLCTDLTVCAGYSQAFEMMCNGSGIDAVAVTSKYHEWNKVRINDSWYNVDCTWDDADGKIYYDYFERNDNYYDTVNYGSYVYHAEEDIWDGYLPACTLDSGATSTSAGTIAAATKTTAKPVISASASGSSYKVKITSATSGATIYYTTDGSEPNQAYSKSTRYTGTFTVAAGKTVKAVAVCNKYADSSVVSKKMEKAAATVSYKITFKANGGKGSMSRQSMKKGVSTAISKNKFSRKYYTFTGWNTKANGKGKTYKNKQKIKLTKNITLYAQWKLTKYKITYKLNGGKNNTKNPAAYTYKTSTIKLKNPTRKGYVFKGWYLDKKFKKKVTAINKGSSGNKTLYAKWKKK